MSKNALRTALWDLRGQYEAALRTLAAAQRCFDEWRNATTATQRNAALREMRRHLIALEAANRPLADVLTDALQSAGAAVEEASR